MKKRNLLLCGILSAAMVMEAMVPALAESAATEQVTESVEASAVIPQEAPTPVLA